MGKDIDTQQRRDKWDAYANSVDTTTSSKRATFKLTAENVIELLGDKQEGMLLDVGCGFGEIDILLAEKTNFQITGCDISSACIERAKKNAEEANVARSTVFEKGDVYALPYEDNSFDVVISFGYASAATYEGAQSEVARVLKSGGLLICDFINPLCLYRITKLPKRILKIIGENRKEYNPMAANGISKHFGGYGLRFVSQRLFNTYPPINIFPTKSMILFDRTVGRIFNKVLGRVRIVCFKKI